MGQGRNSILLEQQGWDVTGLDPSEFGVNEAKERPRKPGVRIDAQIQDVYRFDFAESQRDLVCLMYFIIPTSQTESTLAAGTDRRRGELEGRIRTLTSRRYR